MSDEKKTTTVYQIGNFRSPIEARGLIRETACFYVFDETRRGWGESREKKDGSAFPTFEEAKAALIARRKAALDAAKINVDLKRRGVEEARAIKPPVSAQQREGPKP